MARFSAVLDACVLVPIALADTLLHLAEADLFRPLWSTCILEETVRALEHIHLDMRSSGAAQRRVNVMNEAVGDACVDGWGDILGGIELPDENDRHVLAAAIQGRADLIITTNVKDFPTRTLEQFNMEAQHPDDFLMNQLDLDPERVLAALHEQSTATRNPVLDVEDVLERLGRCGAPKFSVAGRRQLWRITTTPDG